jgi:hypothetical protein
MNVGERAAAEEEDRGNRGPCVAVKMCFDNIVWMFTRTDYFTRNRIVHT